MSDVKDMGGADINTQPGPADGAGVFKFGDALGDAAQGDEILGNEPDSQTGTGEGESDTGEVEGEETQDTGTETGENAEDAPTSEDESQGEDEPESEVKTDDQGREYIEVDGKKYYQSFDKHPEWRDLKDSQRLIDTIMDEQGFDSPQEIADALKAGMTVQELLDGRDPEELITDADAFRSQQEQQAAEAARLQMEQETPEESIERLLKENQSLREGHQADEDARQAEAENKRILSTFNESLENVIESMDDSASDDVRQLVKLSLGLDNEVNTVDMRNKAATKKAAKTVTGQIRDLIGRIEQAAVDRYAEGKGNLIPMKKATGEVAKTKKKVKQYDPGEAGMQEGFDDAGQELLDELRAAGWE